MEVLLIPKLNYITFANNSRAHTFVVSLDLREHFVIQHEMKLLYACIYLFVTNCFCEFFKIYTRFLKICHDKHPNVLYLQESV